DPAKYIAEIVVLQGTGARDIPFQRHGGGCLQRLPMPAGRAELLRKPTLHRDFGKAPHAQPPRVGDASFPGLGAAWRCHGLAVGEDELRYPLGMAPHPVEARGDAHGTPAIAPGRAAEAVHLGQVVAAKLVEVARSGRRAGFAVPALSVAQDPEAVLQCLDLRIPDSDVGQHGITEYDPRPILPA